LNRGQQLRGAERRESRGHSPPVHEAVRHEIRPDACECQDGPIGDEIGRGEGFENLEFLPDHDGGLARSARSASSRAVVCSFVVSSELLALASR
jgi:hypothetical protein